MSIVWLLQNILPRQYQILLRTNIKYYATPNITPHQISNITQHQYQISCRTNIKIVSTHLWPNDLHQNSQVIGLISKIQR